MVELIKGSGAIVIEKDATHGGQKGHFRLPGTISPKHEGWRRGMTADPENPGALIHSHAPQTLSVATSQEKEELRNANE